VRRGGNAAVDLHRAEHLRAERNALGIELLVVLDERFNAHEVVPALEVPCAITERENVDIASIAAYCGTTRSMIVSIAAYCGTTSGDMYDRTTNPAGCGSPADQFDYSRRFRSLISSDAASSFQHAVPSRRGIRGGARHEIHTIQQCAIEPSINKHNATYVICFE
jgi:hypothetical protein